MDFESILYEIGDYGKYQKILLFVLLTPSAITLCLYEYLFMLHTPDHWCRVPQLDGLPNDLTKLTRPQMVEKQETKGPAQCHQYNVDYRQVASQLWTFSQNLTERQYLDHYQLTSGQNLSYHDYIESHLNLSQYDVTGCKHGWLYDTTSFGESATTKVMPTMPIIQMLIE